MWVYNFIGVFSGVGNGFPKNGSSFENKHVTWIVYFLCNATLDLLCCCQWKCPLKFGNKYNKVNSYLHIYYSSIFLSEISHTFCVHVQMEASCFMYMYVVQCTISKKKLPANDRINTCTRKRNLQEERLVHSFVLAYTTHTHK